MRHAVTTGKTIHMSHDMNTEVTAFGRACNIHQGENGEVIVTVTNFAECETCGKFQAVHGTEKTRGWGVEGHRAWEVANGVCERVFEGGMVAGWTGKVEGNAVATVVEFLEG